MSPCTGGVSLARCWLPCGDGVDRRVSSYRPFASSTNPSEPHDIAKSRRLRLHLCGKPHASDCFHVPVTPREYRSVSHGVKLDLFPGRLHWGLPKSIMFDLMTSGQRPAQGAWKSSIANVMGPPGRPERSRLMVMTSFNRFFSRLTFQAKQARPRAGMHPKRRCIPSNLQSLPSHPWMAGHGSCQTNLTTWRPTHDITLHRPSKVNVVSRSSRTEPYENRSTRLHLRNVYRLNTMGNHYCLLHGVRPTVFSSLLLATRCRDDARPPPSGQSVFVETGHHPPAATSTSTTDLRSACHVSCFRSIWLCALAAQSLARSSRHG